MFHKVVWQHMQGVVGFLITTLLQIYHKSLPVKFFFENRLRFDRLMHGHEFVVLLLAYPVDTASKYEN